VGNPKASDRIVWNVCSRLLWPIPSSSGSSAPSERECLDHVPVLNERPLHRLLRAYLAYYNAARPHHALDQNSPHPRSLAPPSRKRILAIPHLGGLHHRYQRVA